MLCAIQMFTTIFIFWLVCAFVALKKPISWPWVFAWVCGEAHDRPHIVFIGPIQKKLVYIYQRM